MQRSCEIQNVVKIVNTLAYELLRACLLSVAVVLLFLFFFCFSLQHFQTCKKMFQTCVEFYMVRLM